jgi:hypothetical protein
MMVATGTGRAAERVVRWADRLSLAMDDLQVVVELNQSMWAQLQNALEDVTGDEVHWRPLPQANSIDLIVRHLRIEAEWHLNSLAHGEPMPTVAVHPTQSVIDAVTFDFEQNLTALEELYTRFLEILKQTSLTTLRQRTAAAYGKAVENTHQYLLGYHQATHLAMHCGQIRSVRNLYRKTRGEPARFFPDNPTYPK